MTHQRFLRPPEFNPNPTFPSLCEPEIFFHIIPLAKNVLTKCHRQAYRKARFPRDSVPLRCINNISDLSRSPFLGLQFSDLQICDVGLQVLCLSQWAHQNHLGEPWAPPIRTLITGRRKAVERISQLILIFSVLNSDPSS